jgi:ABC-type sulfate/molybdate transport systems ATPase subunit
LADALPHTLSGGEAQRVALARAFAVEPRLLFLDEPFSSLDSTTRAELVGELRTFLANEATTTLLVTHDLSETQLLADRVAVLIDGDVAQHDTVEAVFERPLSPAVASFLGYSLIEPLQLPAAIIEAASLTAGVETVGIRSTAVQLVSDPTEADSSVCLNGTVTAVQGAHGRGRLIVDVGGAQMAAELPVAAICELEVGMAVQVLVDPSGVVGW